MQVTLVQGYRSVSRTRGQYFYTPKNQQTLQVLGSTIQNLVENMVVSFTLQLVYYTRLFQQV